jgi:predicted kinase
MAKMTIMIGLPASGKSTLAKELLEQGGTVRLNKDLMRTMLHFEKFTGLNESLTQEASKVLARMFLAKNISIIIDDTNLNPNTVQKWVALAKEMEAKIEYKDLTEVSVSECISRDAVRDNSVGPVVIEKMALQYLGYLKGKKVVVCDLDGTLCDCEHRRKYSHGETKDWDTFFSLITWDTLRKDVRDMLPVDPKEIILVSARPEKYRDLTLAWLNKMRIGYNVLLMRENHDKRDDTIVKNEIYEKYLKNLDIVKVIDDRPRIIKMWRSLGLEVVDVGNGVDF